ncbi:AraC family transcriptional regulator [Oceanirhabdus seepicola]|uniref:Helix-turn-helix transcriptional regulator n=1 Tax=Oceanirhabdus seepicola TaxID=2828781 RepID=A0A9J6P292_9CLOT|nr:AraC family transcriptional regulator [Oceanirhabdus seepicola]MCM1990727.1 helix-turn-helix transcriptional regulator [Oceanirhabdus seepicola]
MSKNKNTEKKIALAEYSEIINQVFDIKGNITHYVKSGNTEKALIYFEKLLSYKINDNRNTLKHWKEYANIFNISLRGAAINGGVSPIEVLLIGDEFKNNIQNAQDIEFIKRKTHSLVEEYASAVFKNEARGCSKTIQDICKYIKVNFGKNLSTSTLSEIFHINSSHLSRQFKKEMKGTVTEYIQKIRIDEAKHLIESGKYSMTDTAGMVGFNDVQYFTSTFKKIENMTPTEYMSKTQ